MAAHGPCAAMEPDRISAGADGDWRDWQAGGRSCRAWPGWPFVTAGTAADGVREWLFVL